MAQQPASRAPNTLGYLELEQDRENVHVRVVS